VPDKNQTLRKNHGRKLDGLRLSSAYRFDIYIKLDLTFRVMENFFGWLIFIAVAAFLLRPLFAGFREGARGEGAEAIAPRSGFNAEVVGESQYQVNLSKLTGGRTRDGAEKLATAVLIFENDNSHDGNAVRVEIEGLVVGYLPREAARAWRESGRSDRFTCPALIRGGWDRGGGDTGNFGVRLALP
jgi:hypothetical protein